MTTKQKYAKPSAKVVKWEFNEAICNVTTNSWVKCLKIEKGSTVTSVENRNDYTGTWTRVGRVSE